MQFLVAVGKLLAPEYRPVFFSRQVKSRSLLRRLGQEFHPRQRSGRLDEWPNSPGTNPPGIDPESLIAQLRKQSDRDLVRQGAPAFRWLVRELDTFIEIVRPQCLFLWNGSGLAAAASGQLARSRKIPLLFSENGYLPNTLQLDPEGVNACSSIGRHPSLADIRAMTYCAAQRQEFDALLADYCAGRPPKRSPPAGGRCRPSWLAYLVQGWIDWQQRPVTVPVNRRIPRYIPPLPERFVFFPLQVRSDSQLTIHSPLYGNRLDLAIADLDRAVRELDPTLRLVVKLHPADLNKTDYDPVARALPQIVWVGGGEVRELLARTVCVVTVNSTVGIEGMILNKPVVTLGNNFYVREGLVYPVRERSALSPQLARALREPPDTALIRQYLRYLYFIAFVRAHWRDHSPESIGQLAERMLAMISAR